MKSHLIQLNYRIITVHFRSLQIGFANNFRFDLSLAPNQILLQVDNIQYIAPDHTALGDKLYTL